MFLQLLISHAKSVYNSYITSFMWILINESLSSAPFSNLYFAVTYCNVIALNTMSHLYQVLTMPHLLSSYWCVCIKDIWATICLAKLVSIHVAQVMQLFLIYLSCQKRRLLCVNVFVYGQGGGKLCWIIHVWMCIVETSLHNHQNHHRVFTPWKILRCFPL